MGVRGSKPRNWVGGSSGYNYKRLELEGSVLAPRGYVPVCVGMDKDSSRRFVVHVGALRDAHFCELLRRSAEEFGFRNDGVLRIPFEVQDFEEWIIRRCKGKISNVIRGI